MSNDRKPSADPPVTLSNAKPPLAAAIPESPVSAAGRDAPPALRPLRSTPPTRPAPLVVPGFHPASHVGPDGDMSRSWPVTVVLHGNYDRPEWQCDTWKAAAGFYGWVLCPRGQPTPWALKREDRWHYQGSKAAQREVEAALNALELRYPSRVTRENMVLAGFSLGAILAPGMISEGKGMYTFLFLIEGAVDRMDSVHLRTLQKNGIRGIGFAMSSPRYRKAIPSLLKKTRRLALRAVYVDMRGSGHDYSPDFSLVGQDALSRLVAP